MVYLMKAVNVKAAVAVAVAVAIAGRNRTQMSTKKGATTFSIMTLCITTLSIKDLFATISINDTKH